MPIFEVRRGALLRDPTAYLCIVFRTTQLISYIDQIPFDLVLASTALWELEVDTLAREALVNLRVGVKTVVNTATLLLVEHDLQQLLAVLLGAQTLADDLNWVDEVVQDGVVDSGECSRSWALLLLQVAGAVGSLGAWQDAAGGDDEDVAVGELLLELTGQAVRVVSFYVISHRG